MLGSSSTTSTRRSAGCETGRPPSGMHLLHRRDALWPGEPESERRASVLAAARRPDAPPMALDERPADVQAEPHARQAAFCRVGGPAERLEDRLQAARWQADAAVCHLDQGPALAADHRETDLAAGRRVLDRVAQQIRDHLLQPIDVDAGVHLVIREIEDE